MDTQQGWQGFPGGSVEKNPPAMQEMQVWSLGQEDPLEKEMATHSSILAWKNPWTEEPGWLQSMGLRDWACVHEGGGWRVGSNKLVELKK